MLSLPVPANVIPHVHHVQQACPARLRSEGICSTSQPCTVQLRAAASAEAATVPKFRGLGEIVAVESLDGVRVQLGEAQQPVVEYLVNWKDNSPPTWELRVNLADNLLRDFEERWWKCCREGDEQTMASLLQHSQRTLANVVDENRRSGLHYVAGQGNVNMTRMLCEAGANVNSPDKEGYTPLHMAVGYSFTSTVDALLEAGADAEAADSQGRSVLGLVESLRSSMPLSRDTMGRRIALEEVATLLAKSLCEERAVAQLLDIRSSDQGPRDFLIKWADGEEDAWVREIDVAPDLIHDWDQGMEYAEAEAIERERVFNTERQFLMRWQDSSERSWEPAANVGPELVAVWESSEAAKGQQIRTGASAERSDAAADRLRRSQGGKDRADEDDEAVQDRYRVISFDGSEVPLEEALADSMAAEAASDMDSGASQHANGKSDDVLQEQEAVLAGELVG